MKSRRMWRRIFFSWLAGFLATLVFHQIALWLLHRAGMTPRAPYSMKPVPPLGVPAVISLAFWGGVWGIIMIPVIARIKNDTLYYVAAIVFGAILPTLVAGLVVAPLKHQPVPHSGSMLVLGLVVNGAWGLGTALLFRFFAKSK